MPEIWLTDGTFKIRLFDSGKCPTEVFRFSALNNKKKKSSKIQAFRMPHKS
ncbi:hypothetical protein Aconfl_07320 [Algoriphagus confluentis]|uniref:Uncharacterized protein n=1 Tax=Algoriphagus confluentis TaxID=1697556 RepID=A0ABQ6PJG6_9BACT|nr:hypothetical protein Aconfl_07320 [Algoriphagus confluentis]